MKHGIFRYYVHILYECDIQIGSKNHVLCAKYANESYVNQWE